MKILVVDDTFFVRLAIGDYLRSLGHEVLEAADGKEGARICLSESPDLTITDGQMPQMNGDAMIATIRRRRPWVKFIMMSASDNWYLPVDVPLFIKPFPYNQLLPYLKEINEVSFTGHRDNRA